MTCSDSLYRAFTDERFAREFVEGRFRMGRLDRYREIEDRARVDASEGLGHYVDGDGVNEHFELGNPIYILCCSAADVDLSSLRAKMGPFIVKISDPSRLAADITSSLKDQGMKLFGAARCRAVEYTKGSKVTAELDEMARAELSLVQKHSSFSEEKECRLFVVVNADCPTNSMPQNIDVNVGRALSYAEVLAC